MLGCPAVTTGASRADPCSIVCDFLKENAKMNISKKVCSDFLRF